jgi:CBS domain-containing protein
MDRRPPAIWLLDSLAQMRGPGSPAEKHAALMTTLLAEQKLEKPVHSWPPARLLREPGAWHRHVSRVANLMTSDLFTVSPDDVIDLVAALMDWKYIHHVPVEDAEHRLVGLITHRRLLRYLARNQGRDRQPVAVREVMETDLITVSPDTSSLEAVRLMKLHRIACLPVVDDGCLIGILTEHDFIKVADKLLEDFLSTN